MGLNKPLIAVPKIPLYFCPEHAAQGKDAFGPVFVSTVEYIGMPVAHDFAFVVGHTSEQAIERGKFVARACNLLPKVRAYLKRKGAFESDARWITNATEEDREEERTALANLEFDLIVEAGL